MHGHLLSIWLSISRRVVTEYFLGRQGNTIKRCQYNCSSNRGDLREREKKLLKYWAMMVLVLGF